MDAGGRATQDAKAEGARRAGEGKSGRAPIQLELALVYSEGRTLSPGPRSAPQPFAELRALKRERGVGRVARMQSGAVSLTPLTRIPSGLHRPNHGR